MKKFIFFLLIIFFVQQLPAQKKIVLEQFRCYSTIGPVMSYWQSEAIRKEVMKQLSLSLLQYQQLVLTDTTNLHINILKNTGDANAIKPAFTDPDTTHKHLYLDLFEIDPINYFTYIDPNSKDTIIQNRANTVFVLKVWIANYKKEITYLDGLTITVALSKTPAIGNAYSNSIRNSTLVTTPVGFREIVKKGINILFDPANTLQMVEMTAPPAFVGDNYLITKTRNQPGIFVMNKKGVSAFNYNNQQQMIRMEEPLYEEIIIKGKAPVKYPDELIKTIKAIRNSNNSTFLFLRQDGRDVIRDKNYFIKLTAQIDPEFRSASTDLPFTNFIEDKFNYLISEKDTIASFSIEKNVRDRNGNTLYPNIVVNGADSSFFLLKDVTPQPEWPIVYNYVVTGNIGKHDFSMQFSGTGGRLKEIYLDNKLVCIAEGKFSPEKFIIFDTSLSPELLNQLFMISFNRFFE